MMHRLLASFVILIVAFSPGNTLASDRLTEEQCEALADEKSTSIAVANISEDRRISELAEVELLELACKNTGSWPPIITAYATPPGVEGEVERNATFGVRISNESPAGIMLTQLDDDLPAPFRFKAIASASDINAGKIDSLPPQQSGRLTFKLKQPLRIAPFSTVRFAYDVTIPADAPPANYRNAFTVEAASRTIGPRHAIVTVAKPPISVVFSAAPNTVFAGDAETITYTTVITNNTSNVKKLARIDDELPSPLKFDAINRTRSQLVTTDFGAQPTNGNVGPLNFQLATPKDINPGASVKFIYTATIAAGQTSVGNYDNKTTVTVDGNRIGPRTARISAARKPLPSVFSYVAPSSVEQGVTSTVTYHTEITNNTTSAVVLTKIEDILEDPVKFDAIHSSSIISNAPTLSAAGTRQKLTFDFSASPKTIPANGGSTVLVYKATAPDTAAAGDYDKTGTVTFTGFPVITPTPVKVTVKPIPKPTITVTANPRSFPDGVGGDVLYTARIKNNSATASIKLKKITDTLRSDFEYQDIDISSDVQAGDINSPPAPNATGLLTFELKSPFLEIPANDSRVFAYNATVKASAAVGVHPNDMSAEFERFSMPPIKPNAPAEVTITSIPPTSPPGGCDDFDVVKTADPDELKEGDGGVIAYSVEITNMCPAETIKIKEIEDTLPADFEFDAIDAVSDLQPGDFNTPPVSGATGSLTFELKTPEPILPRATKKLVYTVTVPKKTGAGAYDNDVLVTVNGETEPADATITINGAPGQCDKSDFSISPMTVRSDSIPEGTGGMVTYIATINNACDQAAKLEKIVDTLPRPFRFKEVNDTDGDIKSANLSSEPSGGKQDGLEFKLNPASPLGTVPAKGSVNFAYDAEIPANAPAGSYSNNLRAVIDGEAVSPRDAAKVRVVKGANPEIVKQTIVIFLAIFLGSPLIWAPVAWFWVGISGYFILYEAGWKHTPSAAIFSIIMYGVSRFIGKVITFAPGGGISARLEGAIKEMYAEVLSAGLGTAIAFFIVFAILVLIFYWISLLVRIFTGNFGDETD